MHHSGAIRVKTNPGLAATLVAAALTCTAARADLIEFTINDNFFDNITAGNAGFGTADAMINLGDTVRWTWIAARPHSVTSVPDMMLFDSGIQNTGFVFEHTFNDLGDFSYICVLHGQHDPGTGQHSGMSGMINVVPTPGALGLLGAAGLLAARRRR